MPVGAPIGNNNAGKAKRWSAAIDRALGKRAEGQSLKDAQEALDELAGKLLEAADNGDGWALKELGDRIEGKPAQSVTLSGDEDHPLVTKITREIISSKD